MRRVLLSLCLALAAAGSSAQSINAVDYGARLTVERSVDSSQALSKAIDAADGRTVDVPGGPGTTNAHLHIGRPIATSGNVSVRGMHAGLNGFPRSALKFSATPGAAGAQWDFSRADSYVFLQDLQIAHTAPKAVANGIGLNFANAYYPFLDRVWVTGFDTCIKAGGGFFYGELRNVVAMDCQTSGFHSTGNLINNTAVNGGHFSRNGTGLYLQQIGSNVALRSTYREGNRGTGVYVQSGHIISDHSAYSEANASYDVFTDVIYPFWATKYALVDGYFDVLQGARLPRFRSTGNVMVYARGNHFLNDVAAPPFQFDSTQGVVLPSIFIGNSYRTRYISNLPADKGLLVIDRKHPLQLFSHGAPTELPAQQGAIFYNTDPATMDATLGWRVTAAGWLAPAPPVPQTASTKAGSNLVTLSTNTGWRVSEGDWITIAGVSFGGAPSAMVLYTEPGPKLFLSANASNTVSGAAVSYAAARAEAIPAPGVINGGGAREISGTNLRVASGASVTLFQFALAAGDQAAVTIDALCGEPTNQLSGTSRIARVVMGHDGARVDFGPVAYIGDAHGAGGGAPFTVTASTPSAGVARFAISQATGKALTCAFSGKIINNRSLAANAVR